MAYMGPKTNINDLGNGVCILCQFEKQKNGATTAQHGCVGIAEGTAIAHPTKGIMTSPIWMM